MTEERLDPDIYYGCTWSSTYRYGWSGGKFGCQNQARWHVWDQEYGFFLCDLHRELSRSRVVLPA